MYIDHVHGQPLRYIEMAKTSVERKEDQVVVIKKKRKYVIVEL